MSLLSNDLLSIWTKVGLLWIARERMVIHGEESGVMDVRTGMREGESMRLALSMTLSF